MAAENGASETKQFKKIAVFCGASSGSSPVYVEAAKALGEEMVRRGIGLVYGGGNVGLMGAIAETVGSGLGGDSVIGVIPAALEPREISGTTVGEIRVVESMHERKAIMFDEADAFISIPGGYGTLDETLEITTWHQLGYHQKPVGILNINGFFDKLLEFLDHATAEGFIRPSSRAILISAAMPAELIDKLAAYQPGPSLIKLASEGKLGVHERG
ncbi:cytokinin riboside 5 -monophosphate phosphoribohydrolase LOG8 [Chlorella sorokiniana]|uniref:Cytokinin riboside 5'-monophosphate phosphoribohydrolase n=1 Tax=Chlorella sorokiniana TaxID=3076 RepID=A0A2P6TXN5_CHLSO|nr:cytokinin riboside 5 -monophosphate phosphoribohydrolase LOG8 [Chlorella sorokiniana]|eukprot:PRW58826.1 cytokinin riboside 5 -monophosphate phosphoribohydrolase LOG8 [Chlorella sorokiniana]